MPNNNSEFFAKGDFVLVPPSASETGKWTNPESCLWKAPTFIDYRHILGSHNEYGDNRSIEHLFTDILDIPSISSIHYVEQLEVWKSNKKAVKNIAEVYLHMFRSVAGSDEFEELR